MNLALNRNVLVDTFGATEGAGLRVKQAALVVAAVTNGNADVFAVPELAELFDFALSPADAGAMKPDPRVFALALERAQAARAANVPFLLYPEGYRKSPVGDLPHRAAFSDFSQLPDLVQAI